MAIVLLSLLVNPAGAVTNSAATPLPTLIPAIDCNTWIMVKGDFRVNLREYAPDGPVLGVKSAKDGEMLACTIDRGWWILVSGDVIYSQYMQVVRVETQAPPTQTPVPTKFPTPTRIPTSTPAASTPVFVKVYVNGTYVGVYSLPLTTTYEVFK